MTKPTSFWWLFLLLWALPLALPAQSNLQQLYDQLERATSPREKLTLNYKVAELNLVRQPKIATYRARQAYGLAQQLNDRHFLRQSALLLGKSFINQSNISEATTWFNTARTLGKNHNDGPTVIEAATLLSGIEVRKNNYKKAYELNLEAINFINKNKKSLSNPDRDYARQKRKLEQDLKNARAEIDKLNTTLKNVQNEPTDNITIADSPRIEIIYVDSIVYVDSAAIKNDRDTSFRDATPTTGTTTRQSSIFTWLSALLGLLSLGLLGALYYFWKKRQQQEEDFDYALVKKERLIRNYREEIQENERLKNQSIFGNGKFQKARKIDPLSIMIMDMGMGSEFENHQDDASFVQAHQKLLADINLIMQLYPTVFYLKKIGTILIFGTGLSVDSHAPDQLIAAAKDLQDYFNEQEAYHTKPKIAVHSGSAFVSTLDLNAESLDIVGHTFDQCSVILSEADAGQILVSGATAAFLRNKDLLQFSKDQNDGSGKQIELYEII